PWQTWPAGQLPQLCRLPQPSPCWPQVKPCAAHDIGLHIGGGGMSGVTHEVRSNSRYSSTFSCGVSGLAVPHSPGKVPVALPPVLTWKSENSTRPHWFIGIALSGVLKVNSTGVLFGR